MHGDVGRILSIVHPAGVATAATDFARAIARVVPEWDVRTEGGTLSFHDPEAEPGDERWVAVVVGEWVATDVVARPGPLIRAAARGVEVRIQIQMPNLTDGGDVRNTIAALRAMGALPEAVS